MSDSQDEPFDKAAEKEKLRQQLAEEEADREATQHMSDLLLKGATMTNRHCDECGDPLFRHEGREFCPTCGRQRAVGGETDAQSRAQAEGTTEPSEAGGTSAGEQASTSGDVAGAETAREPSSTPQRSAAAEQPRSTQTPPAGEANLPEARQALARKVTALAREAEATTDVGRARELLAAVREGAEALRALEHQSR